LQTMIVKLNKVGLSRIMHSEISIGLPDLFRFFITVKDKVLIEDEYKIAVFELSSAVVKNRILRRVKRFAAMGDEHGMIHKIISFI